MATRIVLTVAAPAGEGEPGVSAFKDVSETFDEVMEKLIPSRQPSSNLEGRQNHIYNKADGSGRLSIHYQIIAYVEENPADE